MSDKVNFDLEDLDDLKDLIGDERKRANFSFQKVFSLLVLNWQYFLFSFIICVSGAILYLRYTEPTYKLSARMLIKEDDKRSNNASQMLSKMMEVGFVSNSSGIDNEVEVIRSRVLMRDVVRQLHLNAEYRLKGRVMDKLVYRKQPVEVELDPFVLDSLDREFIEWG